MLHGLAHCISPFRFVLFIAYVKIVFVSINCKLSHIFVASDSFPPIVLDAMSFRFYRQKSDTVDHADQKLGFLIM